LVRGLVVMSVIGGAGPDVGARLYHHARHLRMVATPRAIGGEAPRMIWSRYR